MARCGVRARIIDKRGTKVFTGQADGLRVRTLEIFDSIGFQHRVQHEGHVAVEANFWVCVFPCSQYAEHQLIKTQRETGPWAEWELDQTRTPLQLQGQRVTFSQHVVEPGPD